MSNAQPGVFSDEPPMPEHSGDAHNQRARLWMSHLLNCVGNALASYFQSHISNMKSQIEQAGPAGHVVKPANANRTRHNQAVGNAVSTRSSATSLQAAGGRKIGKGSKNAPRSDCGFSSISGETCCSATDSKTHSARKPFTRPDGNCETGKCGIGRLLQFGP